MFYLIPNWEDMSHMQKLGWVTPKKKPDHYLVLGPST